MTAESDSRAQLRQTLRHRRRSLDPAFRDRAAIRAAQHAVALLPDLLQASNVGLYWPNDGELDPAPLADRCRQRGCALYLPRLAAGDRLAFHLWEPLQALPTNRFGIREPAADSPRLGIADLTVIFLPLVGWQRDGLRLGMGGGYYDRTLATERGPALIGLAFDCQQTEGLVARAWDIGLDFVLTESGLHPCRADQAASR